MAETLPSPPQDLFTAARPVRTFEDIALQIQVAISNGQLQQGDRLPSERELVNVFGVSRTTLREGLRVLEGSGVIRVERGTKGGIFVAEPKVDQVARPLEALIRFRKATAAELAEFRGSFEGETAYWAAERSEPHQSERMIETVKEYRRLVNDPYTRWAQLVDLDVSFHEQVAFASQNQVRVAIMLSVHRALYNVSLALEHLADKRFRQQEAAELEAITEAISRKQAPLARRLMRRHVLWNSGLEVAETESGSEP